MNNKIIADLTSPMSPRPPLFNDPMLQSMVRSVEMLRNREGYIELENIIKLLRRHHKCSYDDYLAQFMAVESIYQVMQEVHQNDLRKEINPETGKPYPFIEHPTCVAAILAMIGYSPNVVAAALGHDLFDHNREGKKHHHEILKGFEKKITDIVNSATYLGSDKLWDKPQSKTEEKDNALMHRLLHLLRRPEGIAVAAADRLHNLFSIANMPEKSRRRTISETSQVYLPLLEFYDKILFDLIRGVLSEVTPKDLYVMSLTQTGSALNIISNYAKHRARSNIIVHIDENYELEIEKIHKMHNLTVFRNELPALLRLTNHADEEHPNRPPFDQNSVVAKDILAECIDFLPKVGASYELGLDKKVYESAGWGLNVSAHLIEMATQRVLKRVIQTYFSEEQKLEEGLLPGWIIDDVAKKFGPANQMFVQTKSGDKMDVIELDYSGPVLPVLELFRRLFGLKGELIVYDEGEDISAIYEPNDLNYRSLTLKETGPIPVQVPFYPYVKILVKGAYF